jgi:AcrR family transcriptional regulator
VFAAGDPRSVTMDDIAKAAGVGRATLYRRYPSVAAIAAALLGEHERALQQSIISGPPPLGPGAAPADRLAAFYAAMVDHLEHHSHLAQGAEHGAARFDNGAYLFWRAHVRLLVVESGRSKDADVLADSLLAPLAPDVYLWQRRRGAGPRTIARGLATLAEAVLATGP